MLFLTRCSECKSRDQGEGKDFPLTRRRTSQLPFPRELGGKSGGRERGLSLSLPPIRPSPCCFSFFISLDIHAIYNSFLHLTRRRSSSNLYNDIITRERSYGDGACLKGPVGGKGGMPPTKSPKTVDKQRGRSYDASSSVAAPNRQY